MTQSHSLGKKAIVVGGSITGLLAARALSNFFSEVVVLERDEAPVLAEDRIDSRRSTPQGRHIHILLNGGEAAISSLLPGFSQDLRNAGALPADFSQDVKWYLHRHYLPRFESGLRAFFLTRSLVEDVIYKRVTEQHNITVKHGIRVLNYHLDEARQKVTGVHYHNGMGNGAKEEMLEQADFIVDATGRGSLLPRWLKAEGFTPPNESAMQIDLCYCTTFFEKPKDKVYDWKLLACYPDPPKEFTGGVISEVEENLWHVTLSGYHGEHPPTDFEGYLEFAKTLPNQDIYEAIKDLKPLTSIKRHLFPSSMRRHYEKVSHMPQNIIAIGDALCSLNPAFAQGISACALEVEALHDELTCLASNTVGEANFTALPARFFKRAANLIDQPWEMAQSESMKYKQSKGHRPFALPLVQWFTRRITGSNNRDVINQFLRVMHLVDPISSFYTPSIAAKVLTPSSKADTGSPVLNSPKVNA